MSRRVDPLRQEILPILGRAACPLRLGELGARLHGRPPTPAELAALRGALASLAERGAVSLGRGEPGAPAEQLCWVPGDPLRLVASAPSYPWPELARLRWSDVDARRGPSPQGRLRPETPRWVWTLHRSPPAGEPSVIAVRRRVLSGEGILQIELARSATAFVSARELARSGTAWTCRGPGLRGWHPLLQVHAHRPSVEERDGWLLRREREQRALSAEPGPVWLILPGEPGGADRALRCPTRWAPAERRGAGTSRAELELRLPFRGFRDAPVVNALDLAGCGLARLSIARSLFVVCASEPLALHLAQTAAERRGRVEDAWFREDAAGLRGPPRTAGITAGEEAITELGLALPCSAHEVGRAFRRRVMADRAHPDQGGSEEEFRELMRLRGLAMEHLERKGAPARPAA